MSDLQINTEVATFSINENTTSLSVIDSELIELIEIQEAQGPPGPQGVPGEGSDKHYIYDQQIPSAVWTINHNFGKVPAVAIVDSAGTEVVGSINHTDVNTTVITFTSSFAGKAYLN